MNATEIKPVNFLPTDEWIERVSDEIDALEYSAADFASPEYIGRMDYHLGRPCDPTEHYVKVTDCEAYLIGYRDAEAAWQAKCARVLTDAEIEAEADDLEDDIIERIFNSRGGWL